MARKLPVIYDGVRDCLFKTYIGFSRTGGGLAETDAKEMSCTFYNPTLKQRGNWVVTF